MQEHVRRKLEGERRSEEDFECLKCLPRQGTIRWLKLCIGTVLHEVPEDQKGSYLLRNMVAVYLST